MKKSFMIRLAAVLAALTALCGEPVFFVQMTDTHFGQGDHFERARAAVEAVNALPMPVAFVVITGDIMHDCITDSNLTARVLETLRPLRMPVHFVPGNHDLLKHAPDDTAAAFTNRFGPLISSAQYGETDFIFVCTEPLSGGAQIPGYDPLGELERLLTDRPAVVFHHVPSMDNFYRNRMHREWTEDDALRRWTGLLNSRNVKAVIAGHFHRDEQDWIGDVPLYVAPPLSGSFGRQASFRIYEYRDGRIRYRSCYIDKPARAE